MSVQAVIETSIHRFRETRGKVAFVVSPPPCREPRLAKALALGHYLVGLVEKGIFRDYEVIAERMGVSQPRISVLVSLTLLAPEIQEAILLGECLKGEKGLLAVARQVNWQCQKAMAQELGLFCSGGNRLRV